jgi:type VI protein secretion system component Hcp
MRMRRISAAGLTVAAAAAAGTLAAGGVGTAASGGAAKPASVTPGARSARIVPLPALSKAKIRALTAAAPTIAHAYLKVDGAPGESTDNGYKGTIDTWGYSLGSAQNSATGKPQFSDLSVSFSLGKQVPELESLSNGSKIIPSVTLTLTDTNANKLFQVILTNAQVTSIETSAGTGGPGSASVSFNYEKIDQLDTYRVGTSVGTYKSCWDLVNNITCTG